MTQLDAQLEQLTRLAGQRVRLGKYVFLAGLCVLACLPALYWPDPADPDFFQTYVAVPEPLFGVLQRRGVGVMMRPAWLLDPGATGGWALAVMLPIALLINAGLKRIVPSRGWRIAIFVCSVPFLPFAWASLNMTLSAGEPHEVTASLHDVLVDHDGAPPQRVAGTNMPLIQAYRLDPASLPPLLADQAHYVFAQQAYLDHDPARMKRELGGISGAWQPARADRIKLGLLIEHAAAIGQPVGGVAVDLAGGTPHSRWRLAGGFAVKIVGYGLALIGLLLTALGLRGEGRSRRYQALVSR